MTQLLTRLFLKEPPDPDSPSYRAACGKLAGWVGIGCNLLLFLVKLLAGLLSGSISVIADAMNSLSDASSALLTLLGFRIAAMPADRHHPYGHARVEYLCGLAVSVMILLIGAELVKSSFVKIFHPEAVVFTWLTVAILIGSILVKQWLASFVGQLGQQINSPALAATAADSRNDVTSTIAVLGAGLVSQIMQWQIDGYVGLVVAIFILWSGISVAKDTIDPLLGAPPDPDYVREITKLIRSYDKVLGLHDLIIHDYGPGRRFASVHVEMDAKEDPLACHDVIDNIERDFAENHNLQLVIHYDPVVTDDRELNHMRTLVKTELLFIDERLSIHDFRMVRGPEHTNLIFDLVVPYDLADQEASLKQQIDQRVQFENKKYYTVITFDAKMDP